MKEPNFIIAGGVATGTGSLSSAIKDHPDIYLPRIMRPECGFFYKKAEFDKGKEYYLRTWFHEIKEQKAVGERSSLNLHGNFFGIAKRIHSMYPHMKLIFCLRNPTERAYGNYRFTALCGLENLSFEDAIAAEEYRTLHETGWMAEIRPHAYISRGLYYEELNHFLEYFPSTQILAIKSESLAKNQRHELKRVFAFLGVDENYIVNPKANFSSPNVKNLFVQCTLRRILDRKLDMLTESYRREDKHSSLEKIVGWNLTEKKQPMRDETRKRLNNYYRPHNEKLGKLLGWDVSDWH